MKQERKLKTRVVPFTAEDGFQCNLVHVERRESAPKGPLLLVHGAGVRSNIFCAPVKNSIVDALVDDGYDVWLENWRASIEFPPNSWTLDQAALYDHPKAVATVVNETGAESIKAVVHCQGSTSFMMSAVAGLVPQVKTIVTNAVSLHPVVPRFSNFKIAFMLPLLKRFTKYLNPQWGLHAPDFRARFISWLTEATHRECDNPVCKQVSFTYGSGDPALWSHENLNTETHEWLKHEFAHVPMTFYEQMHRCLRQGHLITMKNYEDLPQDFVEQAPQTEAHIAFFAGRDNLCFLPESQEKTFNYFNRFYKDRCSLHILDKYGHLDIFMGQNAWRDVFPLMLKELG